MSQRVEGYLALAMVALVFWLGLRALDIEARNEAKRDPKAAIESLTE